MLLLLLLRFIPISDPSPGCSAWAWAGQKVTARLAQRSARRDSKGPLGGWGACQSVSVSLQNHKTLGCLGTLAWPRGQASELS